MDDNEELLNSWVYQTEGEINLYNSQIHPGTQPIRIIYPILIYMYQRTNPEFFKEIIVERKHGNNISHLNVIFGEEPISIGNGLLRTPRINIETKKIELHETFLSYLWCTTYSLYVIYCETVDFPKLNKEYGRIQYPISQENINSALDLFN